MRVRFFGTHLLPIAAVMAVAWTAMSGESGGTNSVKSAPSPVQQNGLRQLEKDLFKPFQGLSPESSLDGVLNPATRLPSPPPVSRAAREREDKQKNWVFMEPEEIMAGPWEASRKQQEEKEKGVPELKMTPTEQYLYRLFDESRKATQKKAVKKPEEDKSSRDPFASIFDNQAKENKKEKEKNDDGKGKEEQNKSRNALFGSTQKQAVTAPKSFFSEVFGHSDTPQSKEEIEAEKARQDSFKQLLGMSTPKPSDDSLNPVTGLGGLFSKPANAPAFDSTVTSPVKAPSFDVQFGAISGLPRFGVLEDPTTKALSVPGFNSTLPKIEPPKNYFQNGPTFTAPRRSFQ